MFLVQHSDSGNLSIRSIAQAPPPPPLPSSSTAADESNLPGAADEAGTMTSPQRSLKDDLISALSRLTRRAELRSFPHAKEEELRALIAKVNEIDEETKSISVKTPNMRFRRR